MRFLATVFVLCVLSSACDSPMSHRVASGNRAQGGAESLTFKSYDLTVEVNWLLGPVGNISTNNQLLVVVKNHLGAPASLPEGHSLNFYATMPSMGHPMEDAGFFEELSPGVYVNKTIRYNMPGDWRNELWIMDRDLNIKDKVVWDEFF